MESQRVTIPKSQYYEPRYLSSINLRSGRMSTLYWQVDMGQMLPTSELKGTSKIPMMFINTGTPVLGKKPWESSGS
jgi:hypothetical protein